VTAELALAFVLGMVFGVTILLYLAFRLEPEDLLTVDEVADALADRLRNS
jgi:hypothetical protein